ncbi:small RNA-binding protein 11, chloroplastic-like isoform X1 [Magnolia sinica]|uniref:small RNA-binding protein 11, chloroplastic-like isoform X1 n=1 Tax=Magnolia sinica TaxID=86752 RepID=UPI002657DA09|nr:small RNA-binding protein 11, chloroplastic-like isoform X1 [Magnolia sinica]
MLDPCPSVSHRAHFRLPPSLFSEREREMGSFLGRKMAGIRCFFVGPTSLKRLILLRNFSSQLFVSRLSYYTTDEELTKAFSKFGKVTEARLVRDRRTQRPKGFGFVTYESEVEAQKALKAMDGRIFGGRLIFVEVAKPTADEVKAAP